MNNLDQLLADLQKDTGMEKAASATQTVPTPDISLDLAGLLEKRAGIDLIKKAQEEGEALAKELLAQLGQANSQATELAPPSVEPQTVAPVIPTPEGTLNQVSDQLVQTAVAEGATSDDLVDPVIDQEKIAALNDLLNSGFDFDTAVELVKQASQASQTSNKETEMKKLAELIMEKLAEEGAVEAMVAEGAVPNLATQNNLQNVAQQDATTQPTPGGEGTVNRILTAIVENAAAQGVGTDDVPAAIGMGQPAAPEAEVDDADDEVEKAAAVSALVEAGLDFESAVGLVKQAETELAAEGLEIEKAAAMDELLAAGVDFDSAAALVKQAEKEITTKNAIGAHLRSLGRGAVEGVVGGLGGAAVGGLLGMAAGNPELGALAGYTLGGSAGGIHGALASQRKSLQKAYDHKIGEEKRAAMTELLAVGVDFDSAVDLIKQAGTKLLEDKSTRLDKVKRLVKKPAVLGGLAAAGALGAAGLVLKKKRDNEKQAALGELLAAGVDFDSAVELVKEAAESL